MKNNSENKTVLITGASAGIGRATALKFAADNSRLIITYNKNSEACQRTAQECLALGAKDVSVLPLDLADENSIKDAVNQIFKKYEQIDILINNAGVLTGGPLVDLSLEEISVQLRVNLEGLIKITKLALPRIKESIINVGSNLGLEAKSKLSVYSAAKFGVRGFTRALAKEIPALRIYAVNPALTATRMGGPKGLAPAEVARIIFLAATGQYRAKSGADINVRDYIFGEFLGKIVALIRPVKKLIKI